MATVVAEVDLLEELNLQGPIGDVEEAFYHADKALQKRKATRRYAPRMSVISTGFKSWRDSLDRIDNVNAETVRSMQKRSSRAIMELNYIRELASDLSNGTNGPDSNVSFSSIQNYLDSLDVCLKSLTVLFPEAPRPEGVSAAASLPPQPEEKLPYYYYANEDVVVDDGELEEDDEEPEELPPLASTARPKHRTSTMRSNRRSDEDDPQFTHVIRRAESQGYGRAHLGHHIQSGFERGDQPMERMRVDNAVAGGHSFMMLGNVYGGSHPMSNPDPRPMIPHHSRRRTDGGQ